MKKHFCLTLLLGLTLQIFLLAKAQSTTEDLKSAKWPPLPQLKLTAEWEKKWFAKKNSPPYYFFSEAVSSWKLARFTPPEISTLLYEKAIEIKDRQTARTFVFSPILFDEKGRHIGLNLQRVRQGGLDQIYYHSSVAPDNWHSPLFSPNGRRVILREGYPPDDRYNGNNLFLWELAAGILYPAGVKISDIPPHSTIDNMSIMLPKMQWSPGSRYLTYVRGGNTFGDYDPRSSSYRLYCMEAPTRQDHLVMKDAGLHWSWTYRGQILCSRIEPKNQGKVGYRTGRPSVYAVSAAGGAPRKLFDGGYYAQESPDGKWIAYCDWPGELFDAPNASDELKNNTQKGLFLFYKPTGKRIFIGPLELDEASYPADAPLLQWSPDGQNLFCTESARDNGEVKGTVYRVNIEQQQLQELTTIVRTPFGYGFLRNRGTSPDGTSLYLESREGTPGPEGVINQKFTLLSVDTKTGKTTPQVQISNIASENPDWDFHDEGVNPAFVAAEKRENALPRWKPGWLQTANAKQPIKQSIPKTRLKKRR